MSCWDAEIQTTQMCIISITHKDCVGTILSYPSFLHQRKILWVPGTVKTLVQVWLEFCTEEGKCCCPPWRCAMLPWAQSPADVPAQSIKTHPWKGYIVWGERWWSAPAGKEAALSTSCTQKEELEEYCGLPGPHHGEGLRTKPFCAIISRHCQQQRSEGNG